MIILLLLLLLLINLPGETSLKCLNAFPYPSLLRHLAIGHQSGLPGIRERLL